MKRTVLNILLTITMALAGQSTSGLKVAPKENQNHLNFRMGYSSGTTNGKPTLCIEGVLNRNISIESCGTGYGFVHHSPGIDLVHFRGKWSVLNRNYGNSQILGQLGVGFAEVQVADDALGFHFTGTGSGVETAGPELSSSAQWILSLGRHTELVTDLNAGVATLKHAPELIVPQPQIFPFFELSVGLGW